MAVTTAKVTYSLKPETVHRVEELALKWNVPKSEVIRRAVDGASLDPSFHEKRLTPLQALERLQKTGISRRAAAQFNAQVRRERRSWGKQG